MMGSGVQRRAPQEVPFGEMSACVYRGKNSGSLEAHILNVPVQ